MKRITTLLLSDEDLESLEQPMSRSIDILDFIDLQEIDPIYYQKSYYLSPEETAQKSYRLLCQAMEESGKVALAHVTMRSKQHLACLRVFEHGLVMETMYYPKEIRHMDVVLDRVIPSEVELTMARQLIDNLARPFEPEKYRDEIAPHIYFTQFLEDDDPGERRLGLDMGLDLLKWCNELYVFGDRVSEGMEAEINAAELLGMPVLYYNDRCENLS